MLNGKKILITGGTGSFGKKCTEIILSNYQPEKLVIFSRDELKQFEMAQKFNKNRYPSIRFILGDVRDSESLLMAFKGIDYIIHAAALKQVPAAEKNPTEFIKTNIFGAMNVIDASLYRNVKKVIALSTDKACNPINLYGATKLCSDKLFIAANVYGDEYENTIFSVVRYGNVVGSRGSVVPFFKERAKTGVLPITDERMTRFWITLEQSVLFVLKAMEITKGGEIFVPKIPSMKIVDLARAIAPECEHEIIGIRPGEKIHETLIGEDEGRNTSEHEQFYVIHSSIKNNRECCKEGFKYTSDNNPHQISVDELRKVIKDIYYDYSIEETRWAMEIVME